MGTKITAILEEGEDGANSTTLQKNRTQLLNKKKTFVNVANAAGAMKEAAASKKRQQQQQYEQTAGTVTSNSRSVIKEEEEGEDEDTSKNKSNTLNQAIPEDENDDGLNTDEDMGDAQNQLNISHDETHPHPGGIQVVENRVETHHGDEQSLDPNHPDSIINDGKEYLMIDVEVGKQVQLFGNSDSPTDIKNRKEFSNKKKESSSSVRYSNADKSQDDIEKDLDGDNTPLDGEIPQIQLAKPEKFLEVQINSPSEDDKEKIVENYQI